MASAILRREPRPAAVRTLSRDSGFISV
jgi:hypothetical protein